MLDDDDKPRSVSGGLFAQRLLDHLGAFRVLGSLVQGKPIHIHGFDNIHLIHEIAYRTRDAAHLNVTNDLV